MPMDMMGGAPPELAAMMGGGAPAGPPAEEAEEDLSPEEHLRKAIEHAQQAQVGEPDDADSHSLAKVTAELYKILAARQDAEMSAGGGNPKQLRALGRSYG